MAGQKPSLRADTTGFNIGRQSSNTGRFDDGETEEEESDLLHVIWRVRRVGVDILGHRAHLPLLHDL